MAVLLIEVARGVETKLSFGVCEIVTEMERRGIPARTGRNPRVLREGVESLTGRGGILLILRGCLKYFRIGP